MRPDLLQDAGGREGEYFAGLAFDPVAQRGGRAWEGAHGVSLCPHALDGVADGAVPGGEGGFKCQEFRLARVVKPEGPVAGLDEGLALTAEALAALGQFLGGGVGLVEVGAEVHVVVEGPQVRRMASGPLEGGGGVGEVLPNGSQPAVVAECAAKRGRGLAVGSDQLMVVTIAADGGADAEAGHTVDRDQEALVRG